jgi:hypothetical protein
MIALATLTTTLLFHRLVIEDGLRGAIADARGAQLQTMMASISLSSEQDFFSMCRKLSFNCQPGETTAPAIENALKKIRARVLPEKEDVVIPYQLPINALSEDVHGEQFVYAKLHGADRVAIDQSTYNHLVWRHKRIFSSLVVIAHILWIFGAFAILAVHQNRKIHAYIKIE